MSNLRWILLFAGLAILLLLYFSGKPRKVRRTQHEPQDPYANRGHPAVSEPGMDHAGAMPGSVLQGAGMGAAPGGADPLMDGTGAHSYGRHDDIEHFDPAEFDSADLQRPASPPHEHYAREARMAAAPGPANAAAGIAAGPHPDELQQPANPQQRANAGSTLGGKLDALSARLTGRKKAPAQAASAGQIEEKVILLHVVAPEGQVIDGELLLQVFEQRSYHFGERNIFHALHQGQIVFSIAKMIEPGSFDVDDIASFETPGLVLILQLPGPVAADAALDYLLHEAGELATALGCRVLDSKRSTLSRQTTQHLRESINSYMHRQKYFGKVSS